MLTKQQLTTSLNFQRAMLEYHLIRKDDDYMPGARKTFITESRAKIARLEAQLKEVIA